MDGRKAGTPAEIKEDIHLGLRKKDNMKFLALKNPNFTSKFRDFFKVEKEKEFKII